MKTAIILMTIMGCDDSATQCHHIQTIDQNYASVAQCNAETDKMLDSLEAADYPMILAVCEAKPETSEQVAGVVEQANPAPVEASSTVEVDAGMPAVPPRPKADVANRQRALAPEAEEAVSPGVLTSVRQRLQGISLKDVAMKPVHVVTDGYSWAMRKISR